MFKILILVLILALLTLSQSKISKSLTWFFLFATLIVMGLRNAICYQDTIRYVNDYMTLPNIQLERLANYFSKDVVFWYIAKLINTLTNSNYTIWLFTISLVYITAFYHLMKRESKLPAVSALIMVVIGLYYFAFTGLRQALALAFISFSLFYLLNNETKKALIMVAGAGVFHITSLVFLVIFPIRNLIISRRLLLFYSAAGVLVFALGSQLSGFINAITITDRFAVYAEKDSVLNFTGFFIRLALFISSYLLLGKKKYEYKYSILLQLAIIGLITQSLSAYIAEMFRISIYFSISYIILVANAMCEYKARTGRFILPLLIITFFTFYILLSNGSIINKDYCFFWDTTIPPSLLDY